MAHGSSGARNGMPAVWDAGPAGAGASDRIGAPGISEWERVRRQGLKRLALTLPVHAAILLALGIGAALGVVRPVVAELLGTLICLTVAVFYSILRSGAMVRSSDPMLVFAQVLVGICLVALGYGTLDGLRSAALLWLTVIIVFDMRRLPPRRMWIAATFCAVLLMLTTVARGWLHAGGNTWRYEIWTMGLLLIILPILLIVSARARRVYQLQIQHKAQMAQMLKQLQELSVRDGLTGLYNRRHMHSLLESEVKRWQRSGRSFHVALIDIDHFKRVNDQFGHAAGDAVLQTFAQICLAAFPGRADVLARWGGEEFLLLQCHKTPQEAEAAVARLVEAVHRYDWNQCARGLKLSFSAGLYEYREGSTLAKALERADRALYAAKAAGRDRIMSSTGGGAPQPVDLVPAGSEAISIPSLSVPPARPSVRAESAPSRPNVLLEGMVSLVLGRNTRLRRYQYMNFYSAGVYVMCICGFLLYCVPTGLLTPLQGMLFSAHSVLGAVVPFVFLRAGVTAHLRDPALNLLQILWAGAGLIAAYGFMPATSPSTFQMICLGVVFGFNLRPREIRIVGGAYVAMMLCVLAVRVTAHPAGFDPRVESLEVAMACSVILVLSLQAYNFSRVSERLSNDKRKLAEATEQITQVLIHDPLTGILNRQHMQDLLERERDRHRRSDPGFCVALVDLDHFKRINDTYGHRIGDEALIGFARAAKDVLRETDKICRWGGEEFLILLPDTESGPNAMQALNRLREHVASQRLCPGAPEVAVTVSAGIAGHRRDEPVALTLERADQALYAAKAAGRNQCMPQGSDVTA
ncbi:MAG: diguanylate cyclase [Nevskia sp.]|nr:diguanylate cyclase [Nevskia sp.]